MLQAADGLPERWLPSGICGMFLCDVASYGHPSRDESVQGRVRDALYGSLRRSFDASNVLFDRCYREDRGDGVLVAVPPSVETSIMLTTLVDHLRAEVRRYNGLSSEAARMSLRLAIHIGRVTWDGNGLVGKALNDGFRLLDAPALKDALRDSGAALALIISHRVWEDEVRPGTGLIDPADYHPVEVVVKETRTAAWIRVPGRRLPGPIPQGGSIHDLPIQELDELLTRFLAIRQMSDEKSRDRVVGALPLDIAAIIPRAPDARSDTLGIVRTCLEYKGGLEDLLRAIKFFAGDSIPVRRLEDLIARMRRSP